MPLTHAAWKRNFRLQAATTGGNPVKQGETGVHVEVLRGVLEGMGFERTLEPRNFYGSSTAAIITDFRALYGIANGKGEHGTADKLVLETLDGLLNGRVARKRFKTGTIATADCVGADFAIKYLSTTRTWVADSLKSCKTVTDALSALKDKGVERSVAATDWQPFLQHFRLAVCSDAAKELIKNGYDQKLFLHYSNFADVKAGSAEVSSGAVGKLIEQVAKVNRFFESLKVYLDKPTDEIFESDPTTPFIAHTPEKKIKFSTQHFRELSTLSPSGKDPRSASWITIHEAGHALLGAAAQHGSGTSAADNPYSRHEGYYQMTFAQSVNNADSYAHFAYQCNAKKANLGPWV